MWYSSIIFWGMLCIAAANPAQRVFKIKLNFPTSVFCNNAGQGVLQSKIQSALLNLNKDWNVCSNNILGKSLYTRCSHGANESDL